MPVKLSAVKTVSLDEPFTFLAAYALSEPDGLTLIRPSDIRPVVVLPDAIPEPIMSR